MMLNWWGTFRPLCALVLWPDNRTPRAFSLSFAPHRKTRYKKFIVRFLLDAGGQPDRRTGDRQFKHERKNQASANMTQSAIYCRPTQAPGRVSVAAVRAGIGVFVCLNVSTSQPTRRRNQSPGFRMSDKDLSISHFLSHQPPALAPRHYRCHYSLVFR